PDRRGPELGRGEGEVREDAGRHRDHGERDGEHREEPQRPLQLLLVPERGEQFLIRRDGGLLVTCHWSYPSSGSAASVWRSPGCFRFPSRCGGTVAARLCP